MAVVCLVDRDTWTNAANYINQHFVAVKADFDASSKLVAQLQQAQALLNLRAGLSLISFITPDGKVSLRQPLRHRRQPGRCRARNYSHPKPERALRTQFPRDDQVGQWE